MKDKRFLNLNKPLLFIELHPFLRKVAISKKIFLISVFTLGTLLVGSIFHLINKNEKSVDKILLARESTLNAEIAKYENLNDVKTAEILLLKEEIKAVIQQNEKKSLAKISKYLANTEMIGNGVEIILNDNKSQLASAQDERNIVHNTDLLKIVNILWLAGAQGIAINNERVGLNTPIACAGATILVNQKRINAPFTVLAIGNDFNTDLLKNDSVVLSLLLRGIMVDINKRHQLKIPPVENTAIRK